MKYGIFLWPHANARYQAESYKLGQIELELILRRVCPSARIAGEVRNDLPMLEFSTQDMLDESAIAHLRQLSLLYELFEVSGEYLRPLAGRAESFLGQDLPGILKYKGKTNEQFTHLMLNAALYSSEFQLKPGERIRFLDPMCSRGTSLFLAVNRGWDADGGDISAEDMHQLHQFFKRYLEYHLIKHKSEQKSFTISGQKPVSATVYRFSPDPDAYRRGEYATLRGAVCDCAEIASCFGREKYHLISCDLPYGVRHSAGEETFVQLLQRAVPRWKKALIPGGAIALSFNVNTLPTRTVRGILEKSGLKVMEGGSYDRFTHWVEQAVTRDIAIAVRPLSEEKN